MTILDPQGEPIEPKDARACVGCLVFDHKDNGRACDGCEGWAHEECLSRCDADDERHRLCADCLNLVECPACSDIKAEAETADYVRKMRP